MKYCISTTNNHPVTLTHNDVLEDLNELIIREGYSGNTPLFENKERVIDLDKLEANIALVQKRIRNKSMDMSFGVAIENSTIKHMVIVELRLNYINPNNVRREDLEEKAIGSIAVLGSSIPVHDNFIFIFQSNLVEQARNRLYRMNPRIPSNYIVMDPNTLKNTFF